MSDSDDEPLTLSGDALAALSEFYAERDARAEKFEKLRVQAIAAAAAASTADAGAAVVTADSVANGHAAATTSGDETTTTTTAREGVSNSNSNSNGHVELSMDAFVEDWNESQFWYNDETANLFARQLIDGADDDTVIAVVSTPSVFVALKNLMSAAAAKGGKENVPKPKLYLLEHDQRFSVFPEFVFYDFMKPMKLPAHLKAGVDRMICDPPFLSEDCQTKMALTLRWLARPSTTNTTNTTTTTKAANPGSSAGDTGSSSSPSPARVILCTGERMEGLVTKLYRKSLGVRTTTYAPVHPGLKNDFYAYANFECADWRWRGGDGEKE
ncbi:putative N6-adenine methyltransferase-domain-containing protein [Biscogniauxia marginata]|nr:putative N6-adenine methyltransferase-domain-containing protein [Biscogniauxia marginata]